jgi:hypothetical protein
MLFLLQKKQPKQWNTITLIPLNPNASLNNDTMQKQLFPKDKTLHNTIINDELQRLLRTDATTKKGQDYIAGHYDVATTWEELKKQGEEKGTIADAASAYYYLLKMVKSESEKDNIWMTFYEGLH